MRAIIMLLLPGNARGRRDLALLTGALALLNFGGWAWALAMFHDRPALLGIALVVYGLGLRHAVDADHIAAIDNVTRKLMHQRQRPLSTGFWFAIGHASVVILVTVAVVSAAQRLKTFEALRDLGGTLSIAVSAMFLLAVAAMNLAIQTGSL